MRINDLTPYVYPLRSDVAALSAAGCISQATALINSVIGNSNPMEKQRLMLEKQMMALRISDYPYSEAEALRLWKQTDSSATAQALEALRSNGTVPFALVEGKIHYHARFIDTLSKDTPSPERTRDLALRDKMAALIKSNGKAGARISVHIGFKVAPASVRNGEKLCAEIPLPIRSEYMKSFKVTSSSPGLISIDSPDSALRMARFESDPSEETWIECELENMIHHHDWEKSLSKVHGPEAPFIPQAPYLVRTPYLEQLAHDICGSEANPLMKAQLIYSYITKHLNYAYMPSYQTISNLAEYGASMRRGDCGIQACLFIILCRLSGIQADWEGGMYVTPDGVSCHDWAVFRIPGLDEPWFADCSFGGGAWREGKTDRWNFYFGNLDPMRLPCCSVLACPDSRQNGFWRNDPTDNQKPEAWYSDRGLGRCELMDTSRTVSFNLID
jgi:hypothetical protein